MKKRTYNKPPLSFQDQVNLWIGRGLKVPDVNRAISYLSHISITALVPTQYRFREKRIILRTISPLMIYFNYICSTESYGCSFLMV